MAWQATADAKDWEEITDYSGHQRTSHLGLGGAEIDGQEREGHPSSGASAAPTRTRREIL